jgi:hypothetical protein
MATSSSVGPPPDRRRAAEILAPSYGSGYCVSERLVLTAAHLLDGDYCTVRLRFVRGSEQFGAGIAWRDDDADLALLLLDAGLGAVEPVSLAVLEARDTSFVVPFGMYCWPAGAQWRHDDRPEAGGRLIRGAIELADFSTGGRIALQPERDPGPSLGSDPSGWSGASGAAVFCGSALVAVQIAHQNPGSQAAIEAAPLASVRHDADLGKLLRAHSVEWRELDAVALRRDGPTASAVAGVEGPALVARVRPDDVLSDGWSMGLPAPPADRSPPERARDWRVAREWLIGQGAADYGHTRLRLDLVGCRSTPVHVVDIRARLEGRAPRTDVFVIRSPSAGALEIVPLAIDLDDPEPRAVRVDPVGEAYAFDPFYADYSGKRPIAITLALDELVPLTVDAYTMRNACAWRLELDVLSGGQVETLVIDDEGRPFSTVAPDRADPVFTFAWYENPLRLVPPDGESVTGGSD